MKSEEYFRGNLIDMLFEKLSSDKCVLQLFKGKKLIKTLKQRDFFQKTIFYKKKNYVQDVRDKKYSLRIWCNIASGEIYHMGI